MEERDRDEGEIGWDLVRVCGTWVVGDAVLGFGFGLGMSESSRFNLL